MGGMRFANIYLPGGLPVFGLMFFAAWLPLCAAAAEDAAERRFLYVAEPGIRNDLQYGGHGVLVFDIADGHKFVRRIASSGLDEKGRPDTLQGKLLAWRDAQRRPSKRQKDLADIARLAEAHPEISHLIPAEVSERLER